MEVTILNDLVSVTQEESEPVPFGELDVMSLMLQNLMLYN